MWNAKVDEVDVESVFVSIASPTLWRAKEYTDAGSYTCFSENKAEWTRHRYLGQ